MTLHSSVTVPGPRRVVSVDLDAPLPRLVADESGTSALVVGYRDGFPVTTLDVLLTADPADAARAMAPLVDGLARTSGATQTPIPDLDLPLISIVVSTIVTRVEDIRKLLDFLEHLDYPRYEVILVDNRVKLPEVDALPGLLEGRDVRLVTERRPGCSAGRNAGVAAAHGEIIAFTDDDVRVDAQWLRSIGTRFVREPEVAAVTGMILPVELETPAQIWYEAYYGGFSGERTFQPVTIVPDDVPGVMRHAQARAVRPDGSVQKHFAVYGIGGYGAGANWAVRRSAFDAVGGFDPVLGAGVPARGGEDLAIFIDILWSGGRIGFEPRAVVHHRHRQDLAGLHGQLHSNGVGFTALMCELIAKDRRHAIVLARLMPRAGKIKLKQLVSRLAGRRDAAAESITEASTTRIPRSLAYHEFRGFPAGPAAYFRSRRFWREVEEGRFRP
ncbi:MULTISPECIES: glycosyltransferase [Curtobacterium]|uniref:glycosyltransferase n=1 Tax=Curtobacterium TaxID=2034 RepID=UPI001BDF66E4|nr:glycosyltransferase [Curtobacterium flaccumfaciens]MBT1634046.1 glycosyltransferase [Curtobacterium flaccumfaciens pv. oortii]MCS5524627.1 glycosyltransferase [Curtobacterium flaccumfaciens pv. oortii]MCX2846747.1 glycosyltransferase [Curtobacterium flaccumfaciens pv. oortii]